MDGWMDTFGFVCKRIENGFIKLFSILLLLFQFFVLFLVVILSNFIQL